MRKAGKGRGTFFLFFWPEFCACHNHVRNVTGLVSYWHTYHLCPAPNVGAPVTWLSCPQETQFLVVKAMETVWP